MTDQRTVLGILSKLSNVSLQDPKSKHKYQIQNPNTVNDIIKSVHFELKTLEDKWNKPSSLLCVLKDNRVEIRIKQVNPYRDDLFMVMEILIEPLERSAKRTSLEDINAYQFQIAAKIDISTIISLYGKTSIINQALNQWQFHLEQVLGNFGYFIKKVNIGFYYAADTPLMEALSVSSAPFFLRDSNKGMFFTDQGFFSPKKLNEIYVRSYLDNLLVNNIKSVLIYPVFSNEKVLLGYFEIQSNLPDLGNQALQQDITGPGGINPLLAFLERKSEEYVFHLEFSYAKDWDLIAETAMVRDLSQDGRGIGIYLSDGRDWESKPLGAPVSFQLLINGIYFTFFGSLRSIKPGSHEKESKSAGVHIFQCDRPEGLALLEAYATQLIGAGVA
ncbi:hypothetical protein LPTSP4_30930 [Leptospira ryugenii]|uniref:Uncharacterized protein n=1 Tax=Leptospira ryugenii TaxID=1917863 RepID=A0A2P2E3U3_9LEPT|nr:hypothetical protein LPTSP4_30930 [Leptospira ryugenii]